MSLSRFSVRTVALPCAPFLSSRDKRAGRSVATPSAFQVFLHGRASVRSAEHRRGTRASGRMPTSHVRKREHHVVSMALPITRGHAWHPSRPTPPAETSIACKIPASQMQFPASRPSYSRTHGYLHRRHIVLAHLGHPRSPRVRGEAEVLSDVSCDDADHQARACGKRTP